ncbi:hypothetical protein CFP56_020621 [Quercus suber]|uniref:Uncharacterized protein n=1 Tax=Quercus suber TaxID=58331 RepID=A0AAW0KF04_QUESU
MGKFLVTNLKLDICVAKPPTMFGYGFTLGKGLGNPYENGFLYTFTYEPSSSQCLQKTSPFHSTLFCSLY